MSAAPAHPVQFRCPSCGAPSADTRSAHCDYCRAPLGTLACPSCHSRLGTGVSYCPWCGHGTVNPDLVQTGLRCPCGADTLQQRAVPMPAGTVGGAFSIADCATCHGMWVGRDTVERLVTSHADNSLVLALVPGFAATMAPQARSVSTAAEVRYRACPECEKIMNRVNFSRISGIIVDVCKEHGTWFDVHELPGVLEFVRQGGLDAARKKETESLADERRRLERERLMRTAPDAGLNERQLGWGIAGIEHSPAGSFFTLLGKLLR
jgi:Zn-finger nucleic acid-binding protein